MKSESGQAATEYILLLIVTVALILGLITQFFKPMQTFLSSYMGDYTACLLQTGELPALGGESSVAAEEGCEAKFEPGTLANGRPPIANSPSSTTSSSGKGDSSSGGASGGSYAGSASREGGANRLFNSSRGSKGGDSGAGSNGKSTEIAVDGAGSGGAFFESGSSGNTYMRRGKSITLPSAQFTDEMKKKIEKKQNGGQRLIASDGPGIVPKKIPIKIPEKKLDIQAEEDEFTIGNFMRMLFIIGIILAIVIFVGGQVLQMSKNGDS